MSMEQVYDMIANETAHGTAKEIMMQMTPLLSVQLIILLNIKQQQKELAMYDLLIK